jgi:energy-coupling factor transporter ATP-binding protein EcfA2
MAELPSDKNAEYCPTNLITDYPTDEDNLGGSHKKIALAIRDLIMTEPGGKSIGLEGDYGTGKTTIVNILKTLFPSKREGSCDVIQADCEIIVFDVWAFEGDPLRRAFLERAIRSLQNRGWIGKENWDKKLKELSQNKEIQTTDSKPEITTVGKWVAASLLGVPIGLAFLNAALRENITFNISAGIHWKFFIELIFGVFFLLAPFIVLLYQWWRMRNKSSAEEAKQKDNVPDQEEEDDKDDRAEKKKEDLWAFLYHKITTRDFTETIKTENPSALEFEDNFRKMMKESLVIGRKLVLVFDNLDRVDPKAALELWATLQTFVGLTYEKDTSWTSRLWVIVLYDPSALGLYLGKADKLDDTGIDPPPLQSNWEFSPFTAFLEKTFQIRFQIPSPLLSSWSGRLRELLGKAFPSHMDTGEFHDVYRVYETYFSLLGSAPTIRKLKLFVNQLGTVHRQWNDTFPLSHIAYFNLLRPVVTKGQDWLSHPVGAYTDLFEDHDGLVDNLLAMYCNVDVKTAREIVLIPEIRKALLKSDPDRLRELSATPEAFWQVAEKIFRDQREWKGRDKEIMSAAFCFHESGLLSGDGLEPFSSDIREQFQTLAKNETRLTEFNDDSAKAVFGIFLWSNETRPIALCLAKSIAKGLADDEGNPRPVEREVFVKGIHGLISLLNDRKADVFIEALGNVIFERLNEKSREKQGPAAPLGDELDTLLLLIHELKKRNPLFGKIFKKLDDSGAYLDLLQRTYDHHLVLENAIDPVSVRVIARCLFYLLNTPDAREIVKKNDANPGIAALKEILLSDDLTLHPAQLTAVNNIADSFADLAVGYQMPQLPLKIWRNMSWSEGFIGKCTSYLVEKEGIDRLLKVYYLTNYWDFFKRKLEAEQLKKFLFRFPWNDDQEIRNVMNKGFSDGFAEIYEQILLSRRPGPNDRFVRWCQKELMKLSREEWESEIASVGGTFRFAAKLSKEIPLLKAPENYKLALISVSKQLFEGTNGFADLQDPGFTETNLTACDLLQGEEKIDFQRTLWKLALDTKELREPAARLFIREIKDVEFMEKGRVIERIFLPILSMGDEKGVRWLSDLVSDLPEEDLGKFEDYGPAMRERLEEAARTVVPQGSLDKLAAFFRFTLPPQH